jgi:predicted  nucleic acid-binding Zn-ribbon protein
MFLVMSSMITVGVFFVQSTIREETTPLKQEVAQLQQITSNIRVIEDSAIKSATADARSEQDRNEINRRLKSDEDELNDMRAKSSERFANLSAGFTESETQFKNLMSLVYYLWDQVTGHSFPIVPREAPMAPYGSGR